MTVHNLGFLFRPTSVALIGASRDTGSVDAVIARNLLQSGFDGLVMPVHPSARSIASTLAYPDIPSLPVAPDLAAVPSRCYAGQRQSRTSGMSWPYFSI
jgi:acetyltransferase